MDLARLQAELRRETFKRDPGKRRAVLLRYARCGPNGKPISCTPSPMVEDERDRHSAGKIIYDSLELATAAERELREMGGGRLWPYPCPRSRHGHYHLTSRAPHTA